MTDEAGMRLAELEGIVAEEDGYTAEARAAELLEGLGIPTSQHEQRLSSLAGGYKLRVLLAQTLFAGADVLLLDEPTNHLDLDSIRWLESYLTNDFRGTLVVVSHDRHFMNAIATHVADVDFQTVTVYTGDYADFVEQKTTGKRQGEAGHRAEEEAHRRAQGVRGALRRERQPVEPGAVAREGDREARGQHGGAALERGAALREVRGGAPLGPRRAAGDGALQALRRQAGLHRTFSFNMMRGERSR
jgi:ATPase subunit of ABC transporter with duplicated ATPase domains